MKKHIFGESVVSNLKRNSEAYVFKNCITIFTTVFLVKSLLIIKIS